MSLLLISHIVIALGSVAFTTAAVSAPSLGKLRVSYCLVAATLATGTGLVLQNPGHLWSARMSGLFYISVMTAIIATVRIRLTRRNTAE